VLPAIGEDGVEDPTKAKNRVDDHDGVIHPALFQASNISEEAVSGVGLQEREIHEDIPYRCTILDVILELKRGL